MWSKVCTTAKPPNALLNARRLSNSVALNKKRIPSGSPFSKNCCNPANASSVSEALLVTVSPRKLAFLSQTSFSPPKNGKVCRASRVWWTREAASAALETCPSIRSQAKSPPEAGVILWASSRATRLTSASSDPRTA